MKGINGKPGKICPVFGVKSGIIPIGLGALLIIFALVPLVIRSIPAPPLPVLAILILCGVVFVWLGLSR